METDRDRREEKLGTEHWWLKRGGKEAERKIIQEKGMNEGMENKKG